MQHFLQQENQNQDSYNQSCSASAADVSFCCFALETMNNIFAFSLINILGQNHYTQKAQLNSVLVFPIKSSKSTANYINSLENNWSGKLQLPSTLSTVPATPECICKVWRYLPFANKWQWHQALEFHTDIQFFLLYFPCFVYFKCTETNGHINVNELQAH